MKKTQLTWFDRLMMNITFAEAGVESPLSTAQPKDPSPRNNEEIMNKLNTNENSMAPAHS